MDIDITIRLIEAVAKLLAVLVWPVVLVFVIVRFAPSLRGFISSMGEFSLKGAGFEASAKRQHAEAAAGLVAAALAPADASGSKPLTPEFAAREARNAADLVDEIVTPRMLRRAAKSNVLWVDDHPENNVNERQSLESLGVSFVLATSTDEALDKLKRQQFDAIISDMGRPPDPHAGYTLLDQLQAGGIRTPFIIYAGSSAPEHIAEARRRGAVGCTNRPQELFEMVLSALKQNA